MGLKGKEGKKQVQVMIQVRQQGGKEQRNESHQKGSGGKGSRKTQKGVVEKMERNKKEREKKTCRWM
ncbi:hypothetical protein E2C01_090378 [Portunus trituberculatus]|uniref:Uncharacterized protein n=1 Tax=Portunus trituberculatus TaxID=210409 RepID=A0A5B7JK33_PORTR|nr:hypothetical protein [Portunus trituberculatus]